ncbi:hypothetical protein EDF56_106318 [Novosphingobium sp. PhB165]|uniref:hypothetical protein n=1 Tax=Novosphingobium sp. PhB165 TaxID=2485105 RepID=UPI00104700B6|nr:hypothetical protein [Novosphingobium sp. PhB165]TCM17202.1 hypothetical protein EDF56_106318 [Novosphingobium sp. PhB165]
MDAALKNALAQPTVLLFGALKIELPDYNLCLLDGSASIVIAGETYTGQDPTFGTLSDISELSEEDGDDAPEITVTLYPPSLSATAVLANPSMQGCTATLMVGAADPLTGMAIGTPEILFLGEIDVPTVGTDGTGARTLSFTIVSVFERLFEVEEGQRATNGWHQSIWPGELGLDFMTGTDLNLYWGTKPPKSSATAKSAPVWTLQTAARAVF